MFFQKAKACTITGCISISVFAFLSGIPIEITSFAIRLKICAIIAGIKKYKSIIKTRSTTAVDPQHLKIKG